jgi:hypothetical protein
MAIFQGYLGEMSGSVSGCTWSRNKGGEYVRARSTPTNPSSVKQSAARAILGALSSGWSLLTATQRTQWTDWASLNPVVNSLGVSIIRSGQQAYVGLNARLVGAGAVAVATPPAVTGPTDLTTVTATATASTGAIVLTYTATPLAAGQRILLWQTLPQSTGRNPNRAQARLVGYSAAAAASPLTFTSPYPASVGQVSNAWVQVMDAAGQVSSGKRVNLAYI